LGATKTNADIRYIRNDTTRSGYTRNECKY